jgi:carbamoyltransferase
VLNTSFNLKGEPIVDNPKQAIEDFIKTKMDKLVIEGFLVSKASDRG